MKSERDQGTLVFVLVIALVLGVVVLGFMSSLSGGYKTGADTLGNQVGDTIDNAAHEQELRNLEWQFQNGVLVGFWVNQQRITPNEHALEEHGADAWAATNCYNDHGAFMTMANGLDFYFPCREEDGKTVRLTVWRRESATSNRFHMQSAYTPKGGDWSKILKWLDRTHRATKAPVPQDIILIIDGIIP